jgi:DNA polymerase-4
MDVYVENVFPRVATPFNSFHDDVREEKEPNHKGLRGSDGKIPSMVHVGVDAFFASVEQALNPKLRGKAVLLGRRVVASASYEAKMCGVKTAMALGDALRICPTAVVLQGQYQQYADYAERVRRILETYTSAVEAAALDDFYLEFTGMERLYPNYEWALRRLQTDVLEQTGLSVSIGAARTKVAASIASRLDGPRGFRMIAPGTEDDFLGPLPVEKLDRIGSFQARMLVERGIATIGELRRVPRTALEATFGESSGRQIWERAHGLDGHGAMIPATPRSVSRETMIQGGTLDTEFVAELIHYLCERVGATLRESGGQARTIGLLVRYVDEFSARRTARLKQPTNKEGELLAETKELFAELFVRPVAIWFVGVNVTNIEDRRRSQERRGFDVVQAGPQRAAPLQTAAAH